MNLHPSAIATYLQENPITAVGCVAGLALILYLLQRKPRIQREAEERLAALGKANTGQYDRLRPLE